MLITDLIMGRQNPWSDLYSPNRISLRAAPEFIKENANVMAQYSEWLEAKSMPDFDHIAANEGVVLRHGLKIVAAYKNEVGEIKFISAACPHLGGVVHWNNVEKSWDCPCHGSRFNAYGKV
ncbi:MAG: Rieske 2Fe-2S domain-containing protein, partial [bacterium]